MQTMNILIKHPNIVFAPNTKQGIKVLKSYRKRVPCFKYGRIKNVIQAHPSKIEMYQVYDIHTGIRQTGIIRSY